VVGAKDTASAKALVAQGNLYVQLLQPDPKLAGLWGAEFARIDFAEREKLGVRNAALDAEHYGSDLFNLILVENAAALGNARLSDLCRILVPAGLLAFRGQSARFVTEAKSLGLTPLRDTGFAAVYRKPLRTAPWKVCDSVKWKAGAGGLGECSEITVEDGTLRYADRFENPGDLAVMDGRYVVRDAYNGRTLRSEPLGDRKPDWARSASFGLMVAKKLAPLKPVPSVPWEERGTAKGYKSFRPAVDGKLDLPFFGGHCFKPVQLGKYVVYHYNIWVDTETGERAAPFFVHPACQYGLVPGNGMVYNFPSSKPWLISGVTAQAPGDIAFDHEPGGKVLQTFNSAPNAGPTTANDWPMFRADPARGNSCQAEPGDRPVKAWEVKLGLGTKPYGVMCGERTGLTQPVSAYGLVMVSDMDAERVVAVSAANGRQEWAFHVGSRVDFSPALYNGLCLFAARDGWVYCLDARRGTLIWKLLVPSRERYIGWQEKLGALWPARGDVLVVNRTGYAAAGLGCTTLGGARAVAFKPETGEVLWRQCYHMEFENDGIHDQGADIFYLSTARGKEVLTMGEYTVDAATGAAKLPGSGGGILRRGPLDKYLDIGNSLPRTMADISGTLLSDRRVTGRIIAFSDDLSVAHTVAWGGERWETHTQKKKPVAMNLTAAKDPKTPLWKSPDIELVVDDIVLTHRRIYCVGHYQRVKKGPELWVVAREDGQVVHTIPVDGLPAFMGMSAAGNKLFVATREGNLICFEGKKP
jgi:hypothetical protein